jgi:HPt (histidine-containing phosphotransfer) domain-containing protein
LKRLEGDEELLREQMQFFLSELPGLIEEAKAAVACADNHRLEVAAHRIKGLASGFDAASAVQAAGSLEQLSRGADLRQAPVLLEQVVDHLGKLCEVLRGYLGTGAPRT